MGQNYLIIFFIGFRIAQNAGKRSITLNLKAAAGRDVLKRLVRSADVLVENFRPGVMDRLGVGAEVLQAENPKLIYCAISGFGQTGPWAKRLHLAARIEQDCMVDLCARLARTRSEIAKPASFIPSTMPHSPSEVPRTSRPPHPVRNTRLSKARGL